MSHIERFVPPFYVRNRHVQTIFGPLLRRKSTVPNSKHWFLKKNGIELHGMLSRVGHSSHVIAIFHGLGGHIESSYVTGLAKKLSPNFSTLRIGLRGSSDRSAQTYHAGMIDDIGLVVEQLTNEGYIVSLAGFSLSASMILKWLERPRNIQSAFLVSPPIDLAQTAKRLDDEDNRMYQRYFLRKLGKLLLQKKKEHPQEFSSFVHEATLSSIRGFDTHFTSKKHGFSSADEYYFQSSPKNLRSIQNQICIVHAKDDPFIAHHELLALQQTDRPNIKIHLPNFGGHVGFYAGPTQGYMADQWALEYFRDTLLLNRK